MQYIQFIMKHMRQGSIQQICNSYASIRYKKVGNFYYIIGKKFKKVIVNYNNKYDFVMNLK